MKIKTQLFKINSTNTSDIHHMLAYQQLANKA
jgi:hypothetical protein